MQLHNRRVAVHVHVINDQTRVAHDDLAQTTKRVLEKLVSRTVGTCERVNTLDRPLNVASNVICERVHFAIGEVREHAAHKLGIYRHPASPACSGSRLQPQ